MNRDAGPLVTLHGIGIPGAIAVGPVRCGYAAVRAVDAATPAAGTPAAEVARLRRAHALARRQLRRVRARIPRALPADIRSFIDAHLLMLQDPALDDAVVERIRAGGASAEWALVQQRDALLAAFDAIDDAYLRTRRDDVAHAVDRLLAALAGPPPDDGASLDGTIHVSPSLDPADVLRLHQRGVAGFVIESGGPLSHAAIIARSLRLPAVVGVRDATRLLRDGELAILDPEAGTVIARPDARVLDLYRRRQRAETRARAGLRALRAVPSRSRDGVAVELLANIERPEDVRAARAAGATAIGMYRTEFLFLERDPPPDEDEQYAAYARVVDAMRGQDVVIRTLDLGADKLAAAASATGLNPALGLRALRLGLRDPAWLLPQLRALLRAGARGPLAVMLPMVGHAGEVRQVRALLAQARADLKAAGVRCADRLPLGAMIEVPGAALTAPQIAREVEFLSIGTNDLIQYTLAVDRANEEVNHLYDALHPAVLRLVTLVRQAAARAGKPVTVCGEMAGDRRFTRLLLGLGLTRLSMHASHLLEVKQALTTTSVARAKRYATRIMNTADPGHAWRLLDELNDPAAV